MNKISKKIVALATMAAFVLTLVPAAAFAVTGVVEPDNSAIYVPVSGEQEDTVKVNTGADVAVQLDMNDASNTPVESVAGNKVYIWVEDENGNAIRSVNFKSSDGKPVTDGRIKAYKNGYAFAPNNAEASKSYTVTIGTAGTYTIKAGYDLNGNGTNVLEFAGSVKATVADRPSKVTEINVTAPTVSGEDATSGTIPYDVVANGINTVDVTFTATSTYTDATAGTATTPKGTVISIENNNEGKGLYVLDSETGEVTDEVTVGDSGEATFTLKAMKGYNYENSYIYLKSGDYTYKLTVNYTKMAAADTTPATIEAVEGLEGIVDVDGNTAAQNADLATVAQFVVKNAAGEVIEATSALNSEYSDGSDDAEPAWKSQAKYVVVKAQPEDADYDNADFKIANATVDEDAVWALQLTGSVELVEGDYTVEVGLLSGDTAEVSFTVDEFGTAESLEIDGADTIEYDNTTGTVAYTVYAVDEKGMKKALTRSTDYVIGAIGENADLVTVTSGQLKMVEAEEENIGKTVELYVIGNGNYKLTASKEVTIVDKAVASTFAFDSEAGEANKNNTVEVSLVDQNGDIVTSAGLATLSVQGYVVSSSNEDANVDVDFPITLSAGKADLTIFSDKATTLKIMVYGKHDGKLYANTLTYTVGEEETPEIPVNTTIAMTIGSNDFVVNNSIVNVPDAAPYIANDRTYVPFRALGEALGAEVEWDNDARTVTYVLGDTEIVMTIGETTYTINGEEQTMDVAPEITGDRTYVPVRFVAEALGFKVTALSASDGTTAAVVFQK